MSGEHHVARRTELVTYLTEALDPADGTGAEARAQMVVDVLANLIDEMVEARVRAHLDSEPHLYPDGSAG